MRDFWPFNDVSTSLCTNKQSSSSAPRGAQGRGRGRSWRTGFCPGSFDDMAFQWLWLLMRLFAPSANNNAFKTTITQWASNSHRTVSNPSYIQGLTRTIRQREQWNCSQISVGGIVSSGNTNHWHGLISCWHFWNG